MNAPTHIRCESANKGNTDAQDALLALVRLLARHAAGQAIERVGAEQPACAKTLPTDTGALNDV
jgi:hypothetical protein